MHVTTNVKRDLKDSLRLRGIPAGTTFGDFMYAMATLQSLGFKLTDPLVSVEYGTSDAVDGQIEIREGRGK